MNEIERLTRLCQLLFSADRGIEAVGLHDAEGQPLAVVGAGAKADEIATVANALLVRICASSPIEVQRQPVPISRATATVGSLRLLMRTLPTAGGSAFLCGSTDMVIADAWLLLDATSVLAGALRRQEKPARSEEKS